MRYKSIRVVRKIGRSLYISLPQLSQRELRIFNGDWLELELDDEARTLSIRPVHARVEVPLIAFKHPDMVPATAATIPDPPGVPARREPSLLEQVAS
jgi:antitoxin component of MazEF toxin-antitoxin module